MMLPENVQALLKTFFSDQPNRGETAVSVRKDVEAYAAALNGGEREPVELEPLLERYVKKVALYAYKVTDKDIVKLKEASYSEDDIFEITLSAALGASTARWEVGLNALSDFKSADS